MDEAGLRAADKHVAQENASFTRESKGTVFQYRKYFPSDAQLTFWCGLILLEKGEARKARELLARARTLGFEPERARAYEEAAESAQS
jgi:hypothetical protein